MTSVEKGFWFRHNKKWNLLSVRMEAGVGEALAFVLAEKSTVA